MNKLITGAVALFALVAFASPAAAQFAVKKRGAKTVKLNDRIRANTFEWLSEAPMETIKGSAPGVTGTLSVDPADLSKTTGTISVPVSGMKTGNPIRDGHLQGADWLDAKKFPNITFKIEKVSACRVKGNKARCTVAGTFTCHGVGKALSTSATIAWKEESAKTKRKAAGDWVKMKTQFTLNLADFRVKGKAGVVGNKVGKTIKVWGTLYGNTQ